MTKNKRCEIGFPCKKSQSQYQFLFQCVFFYICSLEVGSDGSIAGAEVWSDSGYLGSRAHFRPEAFPALLRVHDIGANDEGRYRCRVDFDEAPTRNTLIQLTVIGEWVNEWEWAGFFHFPQSPPQKKTKAGNNGSRDDRSIALQRSRIGWTERPTGEMEKPFLSFFLSLSHSYEISSSLIGCAIYHYLQRHTTFDHFSPQYEKNLICNAAYSWHLALFVSMHQLKTKARFQYNLNLVQLWLNKQSVAAWHIRCFHMFFSARIAFGDLRRARHSSDVLRGSVSGRGPSQTYLRRIQR